MYLGVDDLWGTAIAYYTCNVVVKLTGGGAGCVSQTEKTKLQNSDLRVLIPASTPLGKLGVPFVLA